MFLIFQNAIVFHSLKFDFIKMCIWYLFVSLCQNPSRFAWTHLAVWIRTGVHKLTPGLEVLKKYSRRFIKFRLQH